MGDIIKGEQLHSGIVMWSVIQCNKPFSSGGKSTRQNDQSERMATVLIIN